MAIGDLVGTLSVSGASITTFALTSNPGGYFTIAGSNLVEAVNTPVGNYPITLMASGPGISITQSFVLAYSGAPAGNDLLADTGSPILADTGSPILVQ
jgi:hypothetical protein